MPALSVCSAVGTGGGGQILADLILTRGSGGTDYAHHILLLLPPPGFSDLPTVLVCDSEVGLFRRGAWIIL